MFNEGGEVALTFSTISYKSLSSAYSFVNNPSTMAFNGTTAHREIWGNWSIYTKTSNRLRKSETKLLKVQPSWPPLCINDVEISNNIRCHVLKVHIITISCNFHSADFTYYFTHCVRNLAKISQIICLVK